MPTNQRSTTDNVVPLRVSDTQGTPGGHASVGRHASTSETYELDARPDAARISRGGGGDGIDYRVSRLEADMVDVKGVLGRLEPVLARIDSRVSELPSAVEFGELKGRVGALPTTWQFVGILVGLSMAVVSVVKWIIPAFTGAPAP